VLVDLALEHGAPRSFSDATGALIATSALEVARYDKTGAPVWKKAVAPYAASHTATAPAPSGVTAVGFVGANSLIGMADGALIALDDTTGEERFRLGVSGPVTRISTGLDPAVITSDTLELTISATGHLISERDLTGRGDPIAGRAITVTKTENFERPIVRLVAMSRDEAWLLGGQGTIRDGRPTDRALGHLEGGSWKAVRIAPSTTPRLTARRAVFDLFDFGASNGALTLLGGWLLIPQNDPRDTFQIPWVAERRGQSQKELSDFAEASPPLPLGDAEMVLSISGDQVVVCTFADCHTRKGGARRPSVRTPKGDARPTAAALFGEELWLATGDSLWRVDHGAFVPISPKRPTASKDAIRALGGTSKSDVWVLTDDSQRSPQAPANSISHFDGQAWTESRSPVGEPRAIAAVAPSDVWIAGVDGAAHFDGARWHPVAGVGRDLYSVAVAKDGTAFFGGKDRVYRAVVDATRLLISAPSTLADAAPPSDVWTPEPENDFALERVYIGVRGEATVMGASWGTHSPTGAVWLVDERGVLELGVGKAIRRIKRATPAEQAPLRLAARVNGDAWFFGDDLLRIETNKVSVVSALSGPINAIAPRANGLLMLGAVDAGGATATLLDAEGRTTGYVSAPRAAYLDIAERAPDDRFFVGARSVNSAGVAAGEGLLVHYDGRANTTVRGPDGPLHRVAIAGPNEAWAVGEGGGILHISPQGISRAHIASKTRLRDVSISGKDVWFSGDDGSLLRWDGDVLHAFSPAPLVGPLTAVLPPIDGSPGWVVGPRCLFRLRRVK
jgi:hypothetical protein